MSLAKNGTAVVFIVEDDPAVRRAIGRLIRSAGLTVQLFASAQEFLKFEQSAERPDLPSCLVLDVRLPGLNGLELQQMLAGRGAEIPIIFITGHGDVPMSVRAMKAGAVEFLTKPFRDRDLLGAIQSGLERDRLVRKRRAEITGLRRRWDSLTPREREVFSLVARGLPNKQVAAELGASEKTIKVHRGKVMRKMKAGSLADLVRMADRLGIIPPTASQAAAAGRRE
jgi:FixJ family two-component response regulator